MSLQPHTAVAALYSTQVCKMGERKRTNAWFKMLDGSNTKAFLYLQYWKAGKKNHAAVCEYRDKAEGSNIGEIPWKWFVSED